jgi:hypothetical protein
MRISRAVCALDARSCTGADLLLRSSLSPPVLPGIRTPSTAGLANTPPFLRLTVPSYGMVCGISKRCSRSHTHHKPVSAPPDQAPTCGAQVVRPAGSLGAPLLGARDPKPARTFASRLFGPPSMRRPLAVPGQRGKHTHDGDVLVAELFVLVSHRFRLRQPYTVCCDAIVIGLFAEVQAVTPHLRKKESQRRSRACHRTSRAWR